MTLPQTDLIRIARIVDLLGNGARVAVDGAGVFRLAVDAIIGGGGTVSVIGSPGTIVATSADTAVGSGATVALPVAAAGTRRQTVQNTGPSGSMIRVREVGGAAGSGIILPSLGVAVYGGADGAVAALEVQEVAGIATTVAIQFERT